MQKIHAIFYGNFPKRRKTFESSPFRWNPQVNKRKDTLAQTGRGHAPSRAERPGV